MISVVLCSHNPRVVYIARTLAALRAQTLPTGEWELILVDNASSPPIDGSVDLQWHPAARIVREEKLGLTPARLKGIREAVGDVIVFIDDDNVAAPDYLANVVSIAEGRHFLGAWSGSVTAEFDSPPPAWTQRYWTNLVIREVRKDSWSNLYDQDESTPLGAGLCVRASVAREYLRLHDEGKRPRLLDRTGSSLVSGGDNDLAACAIDIGLGCGVMASLRMTHLIPPERLTEEYLLRLIESIAYSGKMLRSLRPQTMPDLSHNGIVGKAADVLRQARMSARERRFHRAVRRGESRAMAELSG